MTIPFRGRGAPRFTREGLTSFFCYDEAQEHSALAIFSVKEPEAEVRLELVPVVAVRGRFACPELKRVPEDTSIYFYVRTLSGSVRVGVVHAIDAAFKLKLPPGDYRGHAFGPEVQLGIVDAWLEEDEKEHDLGTVDLEPSAVARSYGKAPPRWWIKETRGVSPDVEMSDYEGRWLLIVYWAWW